MSTLGEGGVLDGLANIQPNLFVCIMPSSMSDPELISAETLFSNRANVTFFSNFGSFSADCTGSDSVKSVSATVIDMRSALSGPSLGDLSVIWISSPRLTFLDPCLLPGEINCCSICFFSATFFFVGVELLRFFFGDGVPK